MSHLEPRTETTFLAWFDGAIARHQSKLAAQNAVKKTQLMETNLKAIRRRRCPAFTDEEVKVWDQRLALGHGVARLAREYGLTISEFANRLKEYRDKQT